MAYVISQGHYKYGYSRSAVIDFRRQNLTTSKVDPAAERAKIWTVIVGKLCVGLMIPLKRF